MQPILQWAESPGAMRMRELVADRRACERREYVRPCKVARRGVTRYASGHTVNLSSSGALLEIDDSTPLGPGVLVDVGILWCRGGLVRHCATIEALVVREAETDLGSRRVAVRFIRGPVARNPHKRMGEPSVPSSRSDHGGIE